MEEFIRNLINNDAIATIVMSFFPLIELKGGIIFARGVGFGLFSAFGLAFLGSTLAFFVMFYLLKPVLALLRKFTWFTGFIDKVEYYFEKRAQNALERGDTKKNEKRGDAIYLKQKAVAIFVAIPLPMTGVWAGTAVAVFLNLKLKESILPIVIGNFIAGAIISVLAVVCKHFFGDKGLDIFLNAMFILALILFIACLIKIAISKTGEKK